ncbi:MAG: hypothetical protein HY848_11675 [Betaproteobacteria bacterium]|nr:hypothetical protein [Betaproteobacteria bacterium]
MNLNEPPGASVTVSAPGGARKLRWVLADRGVYIPFENARPFLNIRYHALDIQGIIQA